MLGSMVRLVLKHKISIPLLECKYMIFLLFVLALFFFLSLVFKYKWDIYICISKWNVMKLKFNKKTGIVDFDISFKELVLILLVIKILIDCFF